MAGIDNLKKHILKDAEDSIKLIDDDASSRSVQIINQAKEKAAAMVRDAGIKAEKDGNDSRERIIARARLDARNNILSAKQDTIDRMLKLAEERINNMSSGEYTEFIKKLLLSSVESGEEEVIFSEHDKTRLEKDLISRVNDLLVSRNKTGKLSISSETRNIKSGFILKHGGIEVNCSIDSQIRMLRDSLEGEMAGLLFDNR